MKGKLFAIFLSFYLIPVIEIDAWWAPVIWWALFEESVKLVKIIIEPIALAQLDQDNRRTSVSYASRVLWQARKET